MVRNRQSEKRQTVSVGEKEHKSPFKVCAVIPLVIYYVYIRKAEKDKR